MGSRGEVQDHRRSPTPGASEHMFRKLPPQKSMVSAIIPDYTLDILDTKTDVAIRRAFRAEPCTWANFMKLARDRTQFHNNNSGGVALSNTPPSPNNAAKHWRRRLTAETQDYMTALHSPTCTRFLLTKWSMTLVNHVIMSAARPRWGLEANQPNWGATVWSPRN